MDPHRIYVEGPTHWSGTEVICPPALRPAVVVLLAMLAAKGTSLLRNVYVIDRGYEQLADRLNLLGASIHTVPRRLTDRRRTGRPAASSGGASATAAPLDDRQLMCHRQ